MCTLSWQLHSQSYQILFNRDEQRTREPALPPQEHSTKPVKAIYPVDPQGKGTWIACNEFGLSFALLNYYQGRLPKGKLISRGKIVTQLAQAKSIDQALEMLNALNLARFAPFSLFIFAVNGGAQVQSFCWNGKALSAIRPQSPFVSSSVEFETVNASRQEMFKTLACAEHLKSRSAQEQSECYFRFHQSHAPSKGKLSVCMHREDAKTVGFTQIQVGAGQAGMRYYADSPCKLSGFSEFMALPSVSLDLRLR